ncbi:hypothetical protein Q5752_001163 [Cryptotrichosporon argae]
MSALTAAAALSNHKAANYNTNASFVYSAAYTSAVLGLLDARPGEAVCDLGCGSGELTALIKRQVGDGEVVGIDSSADMIAKAESTTAGIAYYQLDAQDPSAVPAELHGRFDAVFTSATLHWCKRDPAGAARVIALLLKPGGRVAYEFGGFGNTVGVRAAIHQVLRQNGVNPVPLDPWYFPTPEQYTALLGAVGLVPGPAALHPRPTPLPTDLAGWLTTFVRGSFLAGFDAAKQDALIDEIVEMARIDNFWTDASPGAGLRPAVAGAKEGWEVMYVRLRGTATKPT